MRAISGIRTHLAVDPLQMPQITPAVRAAPHRAGPAVGRAAHAHRLAEVAEAWLGHEVGEQHQCRPEWVQNGYK